VIKEIGAVIKKLAARGDMAILLVEQFYDFAAELADQYLVMSRARSCSRVAVKIWKPRVYAAWLPSKVAI
jgi:ABC-type branched-subunit amino acid transport system ATPase component